MRSVRNVIALLVLGILASGCNNEDLGSVVKQERALEPFEILSVNAVSDVNIISGSEYKVEIITNAGLMQHVHTRVLDGKLYLDLSGNHKKIDQLTFFVFVPHLKEIDIEEVSNIFSETGWESEDLLIRKHEVGDLNLQNLILESLKVKVTDVGNITLGGHVKLQTLEVDDVASVYAFDLQSEESNVTLTGVGDVYVSVSEKLRVNVSGVGSVYYRGDPTDVEIRNTGVGKVEKQ